LIEHTDLVGRNCCHKFHSGPIFSGQTDSSLGTQNHSIILHQPIHAKNYIYAFGVYDDEVQPKVYPTYGSTNCQTYMVSLHLTSRSANSHGVLPDGDRHDFDDMKECDAPESNKIVVGYEFARNIPNTISWDYWASSSVTWLTLP
jgi:hypothetical protein